MSDIRPPGWWSDLSRRVSQRIGFVMRDRERRKIEPVIDQEIAKSGTRSWSAYLGEIDAKPVSSGLWQSLLNNVVVHETSFFRHSAQYDLIREQIMRRTPRPLKHWSAGCSTGQEAFSLAMLSLEEGRGADSIHATDVSISALNIAARGRIAPRHNKPDPRLTRWLRMREDGCYVADNVRSMINWEWNNLADAERFIDRRGPFDVILCRNVLLYFTERSVERVYGLFERALTDDGWLLLGHAESLLFRKTNFKAVAGGLAYTRRDDFREIRAVTPEGAESDSYDAVPAADTSEVVNRAMVLEQDDQIPEALKLLRSSLQSNDDGMLVRLCLSGLYRRTGQVDAAARELSALARILDGRPDDEPVPGGDGLTVGALRQVVAPYAGGEGSLA